MLLHNHTGMQKTATPSMLSVGQLIKTSIYRSLLIVTYDSSEQSVNGQATGHKMSKRSQQWRYNSANVYFKMKTAKQSTKLMKPLQEDVPSLRECDVQRFSYD